MTLKAFFHNFHQQKGNEKYRRTTKSSTRTSPIGGRGDKTKNAPLKAQSLPNSTQDLPGHTRPLLLCFQKVQNL